MQLMALPPNQNDREWCFESIQDIEAPRTAQLKMLMKEDFQICFRSRHTGWGSVFKEVIVF